MGVLLCVRFGLTGSPKSLLSGTSVGIDRDPPVCHDVQGDIMTDRQPAAVLLWRCGDRLVGLLWCVALVKCSGEVDFMCIRQQLSPRTLIHAKET